jgi:hypothetical protein
MEQCHYKDKLEYEQLIDPYGFDAKSAVLWSRTIA